MFVCEKVARGHRYLYLVESVREGKRVRQRTIRALGRKDVLHASGELDRLIASLARHSERAMVLSDMEAGRLACIRIGGPLLFGRLWKRLGLGAVVNDLLDGRGFEFALERAVFVSVLHRLFVSGSDRSCEKWMSDYAIPGVADLRLHHLYRAMAWLGEELEPAGDGDLAPRCVKDEIEERLFERQRDLFTDLSLVFMEPPPCRSTGRAARAWGHTAIPRITALTCARWCWRWCWTARVGRCARRLAGNTADMTVLLPVVDRLRKRFGIGRVCVVADRGMISAATITALEERSLDYILGARERGTAVIREVELKSEKPFTPLLIERGRGDTQLFVKQVTCCSARGFDADRRGNPLTPFDCGGSLLRAEQQSAVLRFWRAAEARVPRGAEPYRAAGPARSPGARCSARYPCPRPPPVLECAPIRSPSPSPSAGCGVPPAGGSRGRSADQAAKPDAARRNRIRAKTTCKTPYNPNAAPPSRCIDPLHHLTSCVHAHIHRTASTITHPRSPTHASTSHIATTPPTRTSAPHLHNPLASIPNSPYYLPYLLHTTTLFTTLPHH